MKRPAIYIMTNRRNGTLYVGVSTELVLRVYQHRESLVEGFTKRYGLARLVYYEWHADVASAIRREKRVKRWRREWKLRLVESMNPYWRDLWFDLVG